MSQSISQETSEVSQISSGKEKTSKCQSAYPSLPCRNNSLRAKDAIVDLTTNLMKLQISEQEQKLCLYSVSLNPQLDRNNYSLFSIIQRQIDVDLSNHFTRRCFSGYNLFASSPNPPEKFEIRTKVKDAEYLVEFVKVGDLDISTINDFDGVNQKKKSFIEKVIKDILLKNMNTIKFGDERTIVQLGKNNVLDADPSKNNKEVIYKGYYTSAQITESGLFLLVSNVNKNVMGVTVYEIIQRMRRENKKLPEQDQRKLIQDYFDLHKTVLTTYGSYRAYRIKQIDFDASPKKNTFNIKEKNNIIRTVTIFDYYKAQYSLTIKDQDQPLLKVERKLKRKKNTQQENDTDDSSVIFLVPELVFATGIDQGDKDNSSRSRNIIAKTKMDPNRKIEEIGKLRGLFEGTEGKRTRHTLSRLDRTSGSFCLYLVDLMAAGKGSACRLWEKRRGD